jgi:hypothetical protein
MFDYRHTHSNYHNSTNSISNPREALKFVRNMTEKLSKTLDGQHWR